MCQIIFKPANRPWPIATIREEYLWNSDGAGMVWHDGTMIRMQKGVVGLDTIEEWCKATNHAPGVLHLRASTGGAINTDNCHPHLLADGSYLFHNGHFAGFGGDPYRSDTRQFVEYVCNPYLRTHTVAELADYIAARWARGGVQRLVIVAPSAKVYLIGGGKHSWHGGCWYSAPFRTNLALEGPMGVGEGL